MSWHSWVLAAILVPCEVHNNSVLKMNSTCSTGSILAHWDRAGEGQRVLAEKGSKEQAIRIHWGCRRESRGERKVRRALMEVRRLLLKQTARELLCKQA